MNKIRYILERFFFYGENENFARCETLAYVCSVDINQEIKREL